MQRQVLQKWQSIYTSPHDRPENGIDNKRNGDDFPRRILTLRACTPAQEHRHKHTDAYCDGSTQPVLQAERFKRCYVGTHFGLALVLGGSLLRVRSGKVSPGPEVNITT